MTSASELFYNRRSRFGRTSPDLGLDSPPPPPDRSFHHNSTHSRRTHRHDLDGCDPLRRYPHARHTQPRASHQERAAFRLEESTSQFGSSNGIETENLTSPSGPALTANERLPGAVLLARARLRERLRGLPLSGSRPRSRVMSNINNGGIGAGGELRPFDASDWDNVSLTDWLTNGFPSTDLSSQSVQLQSSRGHNKKPSGLTQEAIDCLQVEHFSSKEAVPRATRDCSICLESFFHGDRLICLPCEHRFHAVCLGPWVRIHGDCPYCRSVIVVEKRTTETS
ncbi:hypothetical protein TIFTF001_007157 [Ficus carica]|uniref:RING-type domain-containing protein n=1 Tax=Ficus carica TaxID=3494 RepID=A0AA88A5U8_FICCA|nr:hypothetical protein TIFTF001_007157 [Ficus carica]